MDKVEDANQAFEEAVNEPNETTSSTVPQRKEFPKRQNREQFPGEIRFHVSEITNSHVEALHQMSQAFCLGFFIEPNEDPTNVLYVNKWNGTETTLGVFVSIFDNSVDF